jgi:hypothetical protein
MNKIFRFLFFVLFTNTVLTVSAVAAVFPPIESENLLKEAVRLPEQLPADRSLLIMAFQREQQENVETWIHGMHLENSPLPWLEIPLIDNPGMLGRWFINSGMRSGIPDDYTRAHVISLYPDKAEFLGAIGIEDEGAVYALVVTRKGEIVERIKGDYSPAGAKKIWQALAGGRR